jgi:hypothetical protein
MVRWAEVAMSVEAKDLRILKTDYTHRVRSVADRVSRLERRVDWLEKLLWMSAGAVISWLANMVIRSV